MRYNRISRLFEIVTNETQRAASSLILRLTIRCYHSLLDQKFEQSATTSDEEKSNLFLLVSQMSSKTASKQGTPSLEKACKPKLLLIPQMVLLRKTSKADYNGRLRNEISRSNVKREKCPSTYIKSPR